MSWPPNLAPQTPSDPYDIVGIKNDPLYVNLDGLPYMTIIGAKSRCRVDLPYYDGSVTRDIVDASNLGRAPMDITNFVDPAGTLTPTVTNNGDVVAITTTPETGSPVIDQIATMMIAGDDNINHIPPHQNVLAQTVIRWFDTADATGNVVGECLLSLYIDEQSEIPQYPGAIPIEFKPTP